MSGITKGMKKCDRYRILYEKHLRTIQLLETGKSIREIAEMLEVSLSYVSKIKCDYEYNGLAALEIYERGKPWGDEGRKVTAEELKLTKIIDF